MVFALIIQQNLSNIRFLRTNSAAIEMMRIEMDSRGWEKNGEKNGDKIKSAMQVLEALNEPTSR